MDIIKIILTSLLSVVALFVITKIMGHKQVAQLDFFDYVSGITIGSIGAELATDFEGYWKPLIALTVYGCISVLLSLFTRKFPKTRKYINGTPEILMNNGILYRIGLKKSKLELSEFMLLCREQGYFNIEQIQTAVFEHNGKISIMPKSEYRPLTPADINADVDKNHIGTEIIMDGFLIEKNLYSAERDINWLLKNLNSQGYNSIKDIFLAIYYADTDELILYPNN